MRRAAEAFPCRRSRSSRAEPALVKTGPLPQQQGHQPREMKGGALQHHTQAPDRDSEAY